MSRPVWTVRDAPHDANEPPSRRIVVADAAGRPVAGAVLRARIGLTLPRHWYHVGQVVHAAPELGLFRAQRTLLLGSDLTGCAELGEFEALAPDAPADAWRALAEAARVAAAADPAVWGDTLMAELPGRRDERDRSPFWQGLTRHFYRGDAHDAAARLGPDWRRHLAALLPRQLIYTSFLPESAQQAIGGHADAARTVHDGLRAAGWRWRGHITIDHGGAVLEADVAA